MIGKKVSDLLDNRLGDPNFVFNHDFGRCLVPSEKSEARIIRSKNVKVWRIVGDDELEDNDEANVMYDEENYVVEWTFEYSLNDEDVHDDTFFFHWKGDKAQKVNSPLPTHVTMENPVLERIYQWGEPMVFFQLFPKKLIILNGRNGSLDVNSPRLFLVRGEVPEEVHLVEIKYEKASLRSRGIFFLVDPKVKTVMKWTGAAVTEEYRKVVRGVGLQDVLKGVWKDFKYLELTEDSNILDNTEGSYFKLSTVATFTPRLFYIFFFDEEMMPTEVEYPLRKNGVVAAFPFLQAHLYTATQPALFLLDNNDEVWLWEGPKDGTEFEEEKFQREYDLSKELVMVYAKEKGKLLGNEVSVQYVRAGLEPVEFTNIFPFWKH